jgi:hypothetical protein
LHPAIQITLSIGNSRTVANGVLTGDTEFGMVGARWSDSTPELEGNPAEQLTQDRSRTDWRPALTGSY